MKKIALLLIATCCTLYGNARQKPASVFLSAGQSNADGRAYLSEGLPDYMKGGYKHLHFANVTGEEQVTFYDRVFDGSQERGRFAFSDVTNYYIDQALQEDFYSIKCAYGGTAIALGQTAAKLPFWNAGEAYIDTARAYRGTVGNGMSPAKDVTHVYVLDLSDAGLRSDNLHFNAEWTEYFGMRVYNKLVKIGAVEGRGIEIVKPDEDVVTDRTDLNPVKAWNYASGKCSKESMQQLKANGNYNERHGYRNNQRRGIHPSRSLQRWKV